MRLISIGNRLQRNRFPYRSNLLDAWCRSRPRQSLLALQIEVGEYAHRILRANRENVDEPGFRRDDEIRLLETLEKMKSSKERYHGNPHRWIETSRFDSKALARIQKFIDRQRNRAGTGD
jgi:hypothetical protein